MSDIAHLLTRLLARVAELERKISGMQRFGTVHEVDAAKQRVRMKLSEGSEGKPFLSPWRPYAQVAGALKTHSPPSVGQQMMLMSANGDYNQGVAMPMTWSDTNASPETSQDKHVTTIGSFRGQLTGEDLKFTIGGTTFEFSSAGFVQTGGMMKHDGKNVGSTHTHGGIVVGGASTAIPNA